MKKYVLQMKMKKYVLQMNTQVGGLPWRYEFIVENQEDAEDLVSRILTPDSFPPACMSVTLWEDSPLRRLKEYSLKKPEVSSEVS